MKKLSKSLASLSGSIYKIPNDVSVVSYGDSDWCRFYPTPITSMCQPVDEMGREAASILLEKHHERDLVYSVHQGYMKA